MQTLKYIQVLVKYANVTHKKNFVDTFLWRFVFLLDYLIGFKLKFFEWAVNENLIRDYRKQMEIGKHSNEQCNYPAMPNFTSVQQARMEKL